MNLHVTVRPAVDALREIRRRPGACAVLPVLFVPVLGLLRDVLIAAAALLLGGLAVMAVLRLWHAWHKRRGGMSPTEADHYRLLAQAAGDIFFKVDPGSGRITWTADLGSSYLGYEPGEADFQAETFENHVHPGDLELLRAAWAGLLARECMDLEVRLRRKNGQRLWVHFFAVPVSGLSGGGFSAVGVLRNTQDLHDVQDELYEARRLQTVGTMASGIAHEFNNHLTPVRGFIELALDHLGPQHPVSEGLQTALNRVEHCSQLVAQVQAYGRKSLLLPEPVKLHRLLPSIVRVAMSSYRGQGRKVTLKEEWPRSLPVLWADVSQLQEAVVQLVRNALEAMPDGGTLTVRAGQVFVHKADLPSQRGAKPGEFLSLSVMDTGVGIKPELLEHICDPFFTTHNRAGRRGMGLPVVQGMVAQHGGWLEIRSQPGQGTEVHMFLPLQKHKAAREEKRPADEDGTMQVLPAAPLGKLLVGEDEELIRSLVRKVFEAEGWVVEEVDSFDGVLAKLRNGSFDYNIAIVDLTMGGPPAEEVLAEIMHRKPQTRILVISGFGRDERVQHLLATTRASFVSKPFSPKDL
ncbi:MAG: response regulator, partial [Kiritimatiellae bacterium]|nr:response regulator [Kiritimatiellia bacterium]